MNIVIVGLGLIGGSIAKSLKNHSITAFDLNENVINQAVLDGVITGKTTDNNLENADVIYLCVYPKACVDFLNDNGDKINKNAVVTDVCGIKTEIYNKLKSISQKFGFKYIGSHPMAGKEINGYEASDDVLFTNASYIIVDEQGTESSDVLENLANEMNFKTIKHATPNEHDNMIAFTSQLPHVLACAYVLSPCCLKHQGFSAGSYRDVSRVAKINSKLWAELMVDNKNALENEIDTLIDNLKLYKDALVNGTENDLRELLQKANDIKVRD